MFKKLNGIIMVVLGIALLIGSLEVEASNVEYHFYGTSNESLRVESSQTDSTNAKRLDILESPVYKRGDIRVYSSDQYKEIINLEKEIIINELGVRDIDYNISKVEKEVFVDGNNYGLYYDYGKEYEDQDKENSLKGAIAAIDTLTEEELEILGTVRVYISHAEIKEAGSGDVNPQLYLGFTENKLGDKYIIISPEKGAGLHDSLAERESFRTTLHEVGHIMNYHLERKWGYDDFWNSIYEIFPEQKYMQSKKWEDSKTEDFAESFVMYKKSELNLDLHISSKKTNYKNKPEMLKLIETMIYEQK